MTLETRDLGAAPVTDQPTIADCPGARLTGVLDDRSLGESPSEEVTKVATSLVGEVPSVIAGRVTRL